MPEISPIQRIRFWRDEAVKTLPLATIASFIVIVCYLADVFRRWNLSPIQLIAPADLIVPGLGLGLGLFLLIYVGIMSGWLVKSAIAKFSPARKPYALLLLGAPCAILLIPGLAPWFWSVGAAGVAFGCLAFIVTSWKDVVKASPPHLLVYCLASAPGASWASVTIDQTQALFGRTGFGAGLFIEKTEDVPCSGQVLWWGQKAIIIRCVEDPRPIKVMTPKDGLHLRAATPQDFKTSPAPVEPKPQS